jgi:hypothetical protein
MASKEQLCVVCSKFINYPMVDMVMCRITEDEPGGNAHLDCAWLDYEGDNNA